MKTKQKVLIATSVIFILFIGSCAKIRSFWAPHHNQVKILMEVGESLKKIAKLQKENKVAFTKFQKVGYLKGIFRFRKRMKIRAREYQKAIKLIGYLNPYLLRIRDTLLALEKTKFSYNSVVARQLQAAKYEYHQIVRSTWYTMAIQIARGQVKLRRTKRKTSGFLGFMKKTKIVVLGGPLERILLSIGNIQQKAQALVVFDARLKEIEQIIERMHNSRLTTLTNNELVNVFLRKLQDVFDEYVRQVIPRKINYSLLRKLVEYRIDNLSSDFTFARTQRRVLIKIRSHLKRGDFKRFPPDLKKYAIHQYSMFLKKARRHFSNVKGVSRYCEKHKFNKNAVRGLDKIFDSAFPDDKLLADCVSGFWTKNYYLVGKTLQSWGVRVVVPDIDEGERLFYKMRHPNSENFSADAEEYLIFNARKHLNESYGLFLKSINSDLKTTDWRHHSGKCQHPWGHRLLPFNAKMPFPKVGRSVGVYLRYKKQYFQKRWPKIPEVILTKRKDFRISDLAFGEKPNEITMLQLWAYEHTPYAKQKVTKAFDAELLNVLQDAFFRHWRCFFRGCIFTQRISEKAAHSILPSELKKKYWLYYLWYGLTH